MKQITSILLAAALLAGAGNGFAGELEKFTTEKVVIEKKKVKVQAKSKPSVSSNPNARQLKLRVGEIRSVLVSKGNLFRSAPNAFYLPPDALGIVQVVVEKKGFTKTYFLKALRKGRTVGGVVARAWLDETGFRPDTVADEGRIQRAIRTTPYYIIVE